MLKVFHGFLQIILRNSRRCRFRLHSTGCWDLSLRKYELTWCYSSIRGMAAQTRPHPLSAKLLLRVEIWPIYVAFILVAVCLAFICVSVALVNVYTLTKWFRGWSRLGVIFVALVAMIGLEIGSLPSAYAASKSSIPDLYGSLPPVGGKAKSGGVVTVGQISGTQPNWIFPIVPAANSSVYNLYDFENYLYVPLYWGTQGTVPKINPAIGLGGLPTYTNGGKTVTFSLKKGYTWTNGAPVDANDILFFIDILRAAIKESAANFGNYTPGFIPDDIASAKAIGQYTVQLQLTKAYNTGFFTNNELSLLVPMPSTAWNIASAGGPHLNYAVPANATAIYNYLDAQAKDLSTYGSNPLWQITDGPFKITSYTAATGAFTMVPNPKFAGGVPKISKLEGVTFTSVQAEFNQLLAGNLTVGGVDQSLLPQVSRLKSKYNVFGLPDFGFQAAFYNFKNPVNHWGSVISQLYIRQVFAHLEDQVAYVKGLYKGAGVPDYGSVGVAPVSPFTPNNAKTDPYPYSISTAAKILKAHGWTVKPNGATFCAKPGTGSSECGAGIPKGTKISPSFFYSNSPPVFAEQAQALAAAARQVGINFQLTAKTFNFLVSNYSVAGAPANNSKWDINDFGGFSAADYPTTNNIFNTGGSFNFGGFNNSAINNAINNSVYGKNALAVKTEAALITKLQPVLFTPAADFIYAVSKSLSASNENALSSLTQFQGVPQDWYFTK